MKHRSTAAAAESCVDAQSTDSMDSMSNDDIELAVSTFLRSVLRLVCANVSSRWTWGQSGSRKQISDAINWWRGGRRPSVVFQITGRSVASATVGLSLEHYCSANKPDSVADRVLGPFAAGWGGRRLGTSVAVAAT